LDDHTKTEPMKTSAIFEVGPMPSQMIQQRQKRDDRRRRHAHDERLERVAHERRAAHQHPDRNADDDRRNAPQAATLAVREQARPDRSVGKTP